MSLEKQLSGSGEMYVPEASPNADESGPSVIQMSEMSSNSKSNNGTVTAEGKPKKKVIHFADGSTLEDDDDDDGDNQPNYSAQLKSHTSEVQGVAPVDPAKMEWPTWMRHYGSKAGTKTLSVLEGMGGTAAYYLGITTPKYQSEIDEYNRMVAKQKSQEEELVSWSTGPHAQTTEPVVEDIKKDPSQAMETMEK